MTVEILQIKELFENVSRMVHTWLFGGAVIFFNLHINLKIHPAIIDENMGMRTSAPHGKLSRQEC